MDNLALAPQAPLFSEKQKTRDSNIENRDLSVSRNRGMRYIGSKARIAEEILIHIGPPEINQGYFIDLCSGTGAVAREAAQLGYNVKACDLLKSAACLTSAQLISKSQASFSNLGGYEAIIDLLNESVSYEGPIFKEYSPSGLSASGQERKYFTTDNASKIDGIRKTISNLKEKSLIAPQEESLLIADLLVASNNIANTAGTYGCFLKNFQRSAKQPLLLERRSLIQNDIEYEVSCEDAVPFLDDENDILYMDPPYTKRQYAAYYHIMETIVIGDHPEVSGVTGLRPWQEKSSDFCHKLKAAKAFKSVFKNKKARRIYISYSCDGHLSLEEIENVMSEYGEVTIHEISQLPRYSANGSTKPSVKNITEYLIEVRR